MILNESVKCSLTTYLLCFFFFLFTKTGSLRMHHPLIVMTALFIHFSWLYSGADSTWLMFYKDHGVF